MILTDLIFGIKGDVLNNLKIVLSLFSRLVAVSLIKALYSYIPTQNGFGIHK